MAEPSDISPAAAAAAPAAEDRRFPVAWVASAETFKRFAPILVPLAVGLVDEVTDVTVFCPESADARELEGVPFDVVRYEDVRWWQRSRGAIEGLLAELRKRKVELLHALDGAAVKLTRRLARAAGLPYLVSSYCAGDAAAVGEWASDASYVLAASEPIVETFRARAWSADRVRLMRPGVHHVQRPTCFNEPGHSVAIVAGGPLAAQSAFRTVLECFAELAGRKYDCVFFVIGSGPGEHWHRVQAERLGLGGVLTFAACRPIGQLTGILKAADVYVAPVTQNCIDVRSLLAIAAGVPVLAAGGSGVSDFLRDGTTAMTFSPGAVGELTVKLTALLDDREAAGQLAAGALEYVHEHHSPANNVTGLAHFYRQAVEGAAG